jgi:mannose-1-phosphate guanylyltransferase/mannose-6-phosphate isomerase
VILASDHVIDDDAAFVADWKLAARAARSGRIMTLGIAPTSPSSAYGYIAIGDELKEKGASNVERFVEKPDAATAAAYVEQGMLWNSGNFLFSPAVMLEELEQNAPAVLAAARDALDKAITDLDFCVSTRMRFAPRRRFR